MADHLDWDKLVRQNIQELQMIKGIPGQGKIGDQFASWSFTAGDDSFVITIDHDALGPESDGEDNRKAVVALYRVKQDGRLGEVIGPFHYGLGKFLDKVLKTKKLHMQGKSKPKPDPES